MLIQASPNSISYWESLIQTCLLKDIHGDIIFKGEYFTSDLQVNQSIRDYLNKL